MVSVDVVWVSETHGLSDLGMWPIPDGYYLNHDNKKEGNLLESPWQFNSKF